MNNLWTVLKGKLGFCQFKGCVNRSEAVITINKNVVKRRICMKCAVKFIKEIEPISVEVEYE